MGVFEKDAVKAGSKTDSSIRARVCACVCMCVCECPQLTDKNAGNGWISSAIMPCLFVCLCV